jgi:hypothetical protein
VHWSVWGIALLLVADLVWGFWTPPEILTRPVSLWALFVFGSAGATFALAKSKIRARRYRLAAEALDLLSPAQQERIAELVVETVLKYGGGWVDK